MTGAVLVALLVITGGLASCSSSPAKSIGSSRSTTTTVPTPELLNYAAPSLPANFNPLTPAGDSIATLQVMAQIWPSPFIISPQFTPALNFSFTSSAELVSVAPETIVYQINPKAKWSDGVPVSADDFIYNWHAQSGDSQFTDVGGAQFEVDSTLGYSDIASVIGSNNGETVTVVFKQPYSDWESLFSPLVPAHIAQKYGWNSGFSSFDPKIEVSAGPFEIQSSTSGSLVLMRNPSYWGPPAQLSEINFILVTTPDSYAGDLANGHIQLVEAPAQVDLVQQIEGLRNVSSPLQIVPDLNFEEIDFNQRNPWLSQLPIRQAIA
ncbi:MAG TPA: ABC transporter substrate-binding protein, partial [Acidimicrobiales bacterium]|nr:ABC transporter substrate-binding protein [Acidimicrobiales bacterium]